MPEDQEIRETPVENNETNEPAQEVVEQPQTTEKEQTSKKKKRFRPTKRFVVGAIVLTIVVTLIIGAAYLFASRARRPNYALYVKNGALYYSDLKGKTLMITSNLTSNSSMLQNVDYDLRNCAYLSDNGDYLFFPENMTISGSDVYTFDLCYQNLGKDRQTVRIAKNVISYHVSSDAMTITYQATDGLYQYELKPATANLLCRSVTDFEVAKNSGRIVYLTAGGELYVQNPGSSKTKIDNRVDEILYIAKDFRSVIYRQDKSIHRWFHGKGETEICADVMKSTNAENPYEAYVFSSGKALFLSNAEGYAQLLYHNGQSTTVIADHVEKLYQVSGNAPVAVLTVIRQVETEETEETESQTEPVEPAEPETYTETLLINGDDVYPLDNMEDKICVGIDGSGKNVYFIDGEEQYGTLYVRSFGVFGLDDMQIYDTDVYREKVVITDNNRVIYFKNVDEETACGTLFLNTAELGSNAPLQLSDAHYQPFEDLPDSKEIYYFTDYDIEKRAGTLHVASTNNTNRVISGAATRPFMLPNGQILFMENYSDLKVGDLYVYVNGSTLKIDTGVSFYIPVL